MEHTLSVVSVLNIVQRPRQREMWRGSGHGTLAEASCEGDCNVKNKYSNVYSRI